MDFAANTFDELFVLTNEINERIEKTKSKMTLIINRTEDVEQMMQVAGSLVSAFSLALNMLCICDSPFQPMRSLVVQEDSHEDRILLVKTCSQRSKKWSSP